MYHPDSIKSMERRRRRSGDKLILTVICTKEPKCWNKFLSINKIGVKCLGNEFNSFAFNKTFTLYHLHSTSFRTKVQVQVSGLKSLQEETVTPVTCIVCMQNKKVTKTLAKELLFQIFPLFVCTTLKLNYKLKNIFIDTGNGNNGQLINVTCIWLINRKI